MKRLILIDSDGTLRGNNGTFSDKVKDVIKKTVDAGHYVIICTGRPRYHTEEIMKEVVTSPIIVSNNGADIYNVVTKEEIGSYYIDKEECYKFFILLNRSCYTNKQALIEQITQIYKNKP